MSEPTIIGPRLTHEDISRATAALRALQPAAARAEFVDPEVAAQYGQRLADTRRAAHYQRADRRELGWLFVVAVLAGVVLGIAIASGVGL